MIAKGLTHWSPRGFVLAVADAVCFGGAFTLALTWRHSVEQAIGVISASVPASLGLSAAALLVFYFCGLYDNRTVVKPDAALVPSATAAGISIVLAAASDAIRSAWPVLFVFAALLFAGLVAIRLIHARALKAGFLCARTVVVGSRDHAADIQVLLERFSHPDLDLIGMVRPDRRERLAETGSDDLPTLGTIGSLREMVRRHRADLVIVASGLEADPEVSREVRMLRLGGIAVLDYLTLYERVAREIPLGEVDETWLFRAAMYTSRFHIKGIKRVIDVAVTLLVAVPAALLFGLVALAIRLTSSGPIVYRQERLGLNGKPFMLLKLRTMREDAEKLTGAVWSTENDPRITPVGRVLRKFRLDELPQLWNVLRGDMSLVGPRPERPELAKRITERLPLFPERLTVRPGITGWAQVMAPYAASIEDSAKKLQYDLYYTKHLSLFLDAVVVFKTVKTVIFGREREQGGLVAGRQLGARLRNVAIQDSEPRTGLRL